jgi:hypothetical protein
MGLFDENQISVGSVSTPLFNMDPVSIVTTTIRSILSNENIAENIIQKTTDNLSLQLKGTFDWAKENYAPGLPQGRRADGTRDGFNNPTPVPVLSPPRNKHIAAYLQEMEDDEVTFIDFMLKQGNYFNNTLNPQKYYFFVEYMVTTPTGVVTNKELLFEYGSPDYPGFPTTYYERPETSYPVIALRKDNVDLFDESRTNEPVYIEGKALLDRVKIDVVSLAKSINDNPDIAEVDHAFLIFGASITSENTGTIRYLMEYFSYYFKTRQGAIVDSARMISDNPVKHVEFIEDSYNAKVTWTETKIDKVTGSIGSTGFVDSEIKENNGTYWLELREQISVDEYKVIKVIGLEHSTSIPSEESYYRDGYAVTTLENLYTAPNDFSFVIPLHNEVVKELPLLVVDNLFYDAPQLVFNSIVITKLKWYQTQVFADSLLFLSVVFLFATGINTFTWLKATFALSTSAAIALTALTLVGINVVATAAFTFLTKILGEEFAFLLAATALILAAMGFIDGTTFLNLTAENLIFVANGLNSAVTESLQNSILDLQNDYALFKENSNSLMNELENERELLDNKLSDIIDPFMFTNLVPILDFNESPSAYYARTAHNPNPGILALGYIEQYVDMSLQLPKPNYSL